MYLRNPIASNYEMTGNALRLKLDNSSINEVKSPTFVGRRLQHFDFQATTALSLEKSGKGDEAGLTVYMDYHSHYDVIIKKNAAGKHIIQLRYRLGKLNHIEKEVPLQGKSAHLRVSGNKTEFTFSYSTDGKTFTNLGTIDTKYLSTETAGGFTGVILGMFGQAKQRGSYADFNYFEYSHK